MCWRRYGADWACLRVPLGLSKKGRGTSWGAGEVRNRPSAYLSTTGGAKPVFDGSKLELELEAWILWLLVVLPTLPGLAGCATSILIHNIYIHIFFNF